jgi:hypothetical protein
VAAGAVTEAIRAAVEDSIVDLLNSDKSGFDADIEKVSRREEDPRSVAMKWLRKLDLSRD